MQIDSDPGYKDVYDDNPLGDIDIEKHIIENNYDESIYSVNQGREINFFNFIILKSGRIVQGNYYSPLIIDKSGYSLFSKGLFIIFHFLEFTENPFRLKYNIDIQWNYSVTDIEDNNWNSRDSKEYYGFSLNINDIDMLIDDIFNIF